MLKQLCISVPLIETSKKVHGNSKFTKDIVRNKIYFRLQDDEKFKHCSPAALTIPCTIGLLHFSKALFDLSARITLIIMSSYNNFVWGDQKQTMMHLHKAQRTLKSPIGVLHDMLVKVELFIFPANYFILIVVEFKVPIIFGDHSLPWAFFGLYG